MLMLSEDMLKSGVQDIFTHFQNAEVLTIIQITDIHYDPMYMPNGNAKCGEPMCCRCTQGKPGNPDIAAGYWGDYRSCDIPWQAVQNTLHQIKGNHEVKTDTAIALLFAHCNTTSANFNYHVLLPSCVPVHKYIHNNRTASVAFYVYMDPYLYS